MSISKALNMKNGYTMLKLGMSKLIVIELFGQPDSQRLQGNREIYSWFNSEFKGILRGGRIERRIIVEFENNCVVGFDGENVGVTAM